MAIPTGSGTEVLKRFFFNNQSNTLTKLIDGTANHIYTLLFVSFCEMSNDDELLQFRIDADASTSIHLLNDYPLNGKETFTWNDKLVLTGTDELVIVLSGAGTVDVWGSYIDQDWT